MSESSRTTLLALLLALMQMDRPLRTEERMVLRNVGDQLILDPNDWSFIRAEVLRVVEANSELSQRFEQAIARLEQQGEIESRLLPTEQELEVELRAEQPREPATFGYCEGEPDRVSDEILNVAIDVLKSLNPVETTKKLSFLKRLESALQVLRG